MKNTIKLFMVAAALFISGNLFAQTVTEHQNRLHDLMLCHDYLSQILTPEQMASVDNEIASIEAELHSQNASHLAPTPFDNFLTSNPQDPEVMAYIKVLAIYLEPSFLMGRALTPSEKMTYQNNLTTRAAAIASTHKF